MLESISKCEAGRLLNSLFVGVCHDSSAAGAEIADADRKIGESALSVEIADGIRNISFLLITGCKDTKNI